MKLDIIYNEDCLEGMKMFCKYTGCANNSSARLCRANLMPDKCEFGRMQKQIEVAYQKGIEYGREEIMDKIRHGELDLYDSK